MSASPSIKKDHIFFCLPLGYETPFMNVPPKPVVVQLIIDLSLFSEIQAELTQSLQQLSGKAKSATEVMQRLKSSTEQVHVSCF